MDKTFRETLLIMISSIVGGIVGIFINQLIITFFDKRIPFGEAIFIVSVLFGLLGFFLFFILKLVNRK